MKKIDHYLISAVLKIYWAGQLGFFGIYTFIDLLDKAFKLKAPEGTSQVLFLGQYYLSEYPTLFQTTCPFIFALSTLITLSKFQHNSQLVAINAAGLSTHRTVKVLLITSLCLGGLVFTSQEWINPVLTKWRLNNMSEAWNLKQKKHLNFRDQLEIIEPNQEMKQLLTHSSAIVDIDHIFTSNNSGSGFHATFMDQLERPIAKLYAQGFKWDQNETISLQEAFFLTYDDQARILVIDGKQIKLTIPIEKILLASKDLEALRLQELNYFTSNLEVYSERAYRLLNPFFPFLMLLISSVIALPFIYQKPIYGYLSSLGCSFSIFFMANYLKSEMVKGEVNATMLFMSVFGVCFLLYVYRRNAIPT